MQRSLLLGAVLLALTACSGGPQTRADTEFAIANVRRFAEAQMGTMAPLDVEVLPGVGHFAQVEAPMAVVDLIEEFIATTGAADIPSQQSTH